MSKITLPSVKKRFDRVARYYDDYALIAKDVAQRLVSRLTAIKLSPSHIVDLGCGTGVMTALLKESYPDSKITGVDISAGMLHEFRRKFDCVAHCHAASVLPFPDNSIDLIVSNLMLPWSDNYSAIFAEAKRVLCHQGVFIFSSFGPDTMTEFRQAWAQVDDKPHVHISLDMHDIGDQLLHGGFKDPVMDVERVTLKYKSFDSMMTEVRRSGLSNLLAQRQKGLTGRTHFQRFKEAYLSAYSNQLSLELVFAYAEGNTASSTKFSGEYTFSLDDLRKTLKK